MGKAFEPNEQRQKDLRALQEYFAGRKDGERLSWLEIERGASVKMDDRGKAIARLSLKRLRRPYTPLPGLGLELSGPENAVEILDKQGRRIVRSVHQTIETGEHLAARHLEAMSSSHRERLTRTRSILATLELSASLAKPVKRLEEPKEEKRTH